MIIHQFANVNPIDIVVGHCIADVSWLDLLQSSSRLKIFVYEKCHHNATTAHNEAFRKTIPLLDASEAGQRGTINHFIYQEYDALNEFVLFLKDNNRKMLGLSMLKRIALSLLTADHRTGFMSLSDVPLQHQRYMRVHTGKAHAVQQGFKVMGRSNIDSGGFPLGGQALHLKWCSLFERLTCASCNNAWLPIRSQFLVSKRRIRSLPRAEYLPKTSIFSEYNWGVTFNCFQEHRHHKPGSYPFFLCRDMVL
jgi:hypothetical protein